MTERPIFGRESRAERLHNFEQAAILVLSAVAIAMVNLGHTDRWRFWGNVVGLLGSPFWLHANWVTRPMQWGQFVLSLVYAAIWTAGVLVYH